MLYPDNFEEKIGFDIVRRLILAHCLSPQGAEAVEKMRTSDNFQPSQSTKSKFFNRFMQMFD